MAAFNQTTVTVINNTSSTLININQGHNEGGFTSGPAQTMAPGTQFTFGSQEQFGQAAQGDDGFVIYDIGGTGQTFWTVHWTNLEAGPSQAVGSLQGADAEFFDTAAE